MLDAKAAAARLGISARAVYDLAASGKLACFRLGVGGGAVRFDPADIDTYLAACRSDGTPATSVGGSSLIASLRDADSELAAYFRKAGRKPRPTPSTAKRALASMPLRLVSSAKTT